jgi:hypothetical protein
MSLDLLAVCVTWLMAAVGVAFLAYEAVRLFRADDESTAPWPTEWRCTDERR